MNFIKSITGITKVIGMFSKSSNIDIPNGNTPAWAFYVRYIILIAILFLAIFIFIIWPVDSYTPAGFDKWSTRMSALPAEVWYVLLAVIIGWGTSSMVTSRKNNRTDFQQTSTITSLSTNTDLSYGRFDNLNEDEYPPSDMSSSNSAIDDWRNQS